MATRGQTQSRARVTREVGESSARPKKSRARCQAKLVRRAPSAPTRLFDGRLPYQNHALPDLTEDEHAELVRLVREALAADKYFMSPQVKRLKGILANVW